MPRIRRGVTVIAALIAKARRKTPVGGRCIYLSKRRDVRLYHDERDWWVGYYRAPERHYVCVLPTIVISWPRKQSRRPL